MKTKLHFWLLTFLIHLFFAISTFSQEIEKCGAFSQEILLKKGLLCERPILLPSNLPRQIIETEHFIIHYIVDETPNNIYAPGGDDKTTHDYAQKVANAAEESWNFQISQLGWQVPPGDGICGGGFNKIDIYIHRLERYFGYAQAETQVSGTNGYTSFIGITNFINDRGIIRPLTNEEIKVVIAHEFNHVIQFGYNGTKSDQDIWFSENTATWIEEIQYPEINNWIEISLLNPARKNPITHPYLNIDNRELYYSGAIFCHMLSRWFGNNFIKDIWIYASMSNNSFLSDINTKLLEKGQNLKSALKRYAIWRYFTGERDDKKHFPKGHLYPTAKVLRTHTNGIGSGNSDPDRLSSRGGTSYIEFKNADGVINISFNGEDNTEFSAIVLGKRIYFENVENIISLNNLNDGSISNLSCIGDDYIVLIPVVTEWQNLKDNIIYNYSSNFGSGISTNFWTEKGNLNIPNGTISIQLSSQINSGSSRNLSPGLRYREKTNFERFTNFMGKTIKHINWNNLSSSFLMENDFIASFENSRQSAKYEFIEPTKVQILLEKSLIPEKGTISFQDPWYVLSDGSQPGNHWINATGYYEPTGSALAQEKGVFLDQGLDWQPPYYSVKVASVQNIELSHTGRVHPFYFQGWSASPQGSAEFKNANADSTPVVFKKDSAVVSANYKGSMLSNSEKALSSSSQRKVVRTNNGHLHIVYESMENLWYQKSSNNGSTWSAPKLIDTDAKSPAIAYDGAINFVYVVYQKKIDQHSQIVLAYIGPNYGGKVVISEEFEESYDRDLMPNVVFGSTQQENRTNIFMFWKTVSGYKFSYGHIGYGNYIDFQWGNLNEIIDYYNPYIDENTINLTGAYISIYDNYEKRYFGLVWEQKIDLKQSLIYSCLLLEDLYGDNWRLRRIGDIERISDGSGYERNTKPNLILIKGDQNQPILMIGWVGQRKFYPLNDYDLVPDESRAVLWISSDRGRFHSFGNDVQSVSLNKCNTRWTFTWSRSNDLPVQYVDSRDLGTVYNLGNLTGVDVQISNGVNPEDIYAFTLNTTVAPYPINMRTIYGNFIPDEIVVTEDSREGVVNKEGGVVYYSFGDIKVEDTKVEMKEIPEGTEITSLEDANNYLYSKPFMVNDNTTFVYSIRYGVNDSTALKEALTSTDYIKFRVELIDANTRELLGVFDEVTYNSENVSKYENISYEVNCNGLGERMVQLRLVIQNNVDPYYAISDKYSDAIYNLQKKRAVKSIDYRGLLGKMVYTYALYQNYPNPFNPMTRIRFSIRETSPVSIKLYDIVGRQVALIMNEVKDAGEYEIELDAGRLGLSSGVYFYQMKAGEYTSIKKMIYLK